MKNNFFYSHLIETTDISLKLTELDLSEDEKVHLISLVEANIHSTVVDTVLSELSKEDKKTFLKNLVSNDHKKTWEHLSSRIGKLEDKIRKAAESLREDLMKDLLEAKELSEKNNSKVDL
jgi:hypothetical protein